MTPRRFLPLLFVGALTLAACGGSDGTSSDAPVADDPSSDDSAEPADDGSSAEPDEPAAGSGSTGAAPLTAAWSVPVNGGALGSAIAMSPDGSQIAFMTGGIQPFIEIHDGATGALLNSAEYHGQGVQLVWTTDDHLVSWDSERLHRVDVATLTYPGGVDLTIAPGAEECPTGVFSVEFDRSSNAMLVSDFHDAGIIVCRLDIGAATITSTVIEGQAGLSQAFLRPETGELIATYSAESITSTDSVAVLDATTLEVKSSGPTSTGQPVTAATATDLVIRADRATDTLESTGQPLAAFATGDRFGPYLLGGQSGELLVMDATTGVAVFAGSESFRPVVGTDDGSKIAVLRQDSLELYILS